MTLTSMFRWQAEACERLGSPMYADILTRIAMDSEQDGVSARLLAGHEDDPGPSALALRLVGSVHRLVLEGRAAELAAYYPSVGGAWDPDAGWAAFHALLHDQPDAVREWLDRPPQTNEVGRASALMGGLLHLDGWLAEPVRLFEIGSSGGLLLRVDRFGYTDDEGREFGDPAAGLLLGGAWRGRALVPRPELRVVERLGSDVMPVDATSTQGRVTLTSYVWPDQAARLTRLRGALEVAARVPAEVRRQDAASFVRDVRLEDDTTTVLWHSVMWQYLQPPERQAVSDRIAELGAEATGRRRFAHLCLEPMRRTPDAEHEFLVVLESWPGGERRVLGTCAAHGIPAVWE